MIFRRFLLPFCRWQQNLVLKKGRKSYLLQHFKAWCPQKGHTYLDIPATERLTEQREIKIEIKYTLRSRKSHHYNILKTTGNKFVTAPFGTVTEY